MRRAIERLTAERIEVPEPPDYSETLGVISNNLTVTAQRVGVLAKSPMLVMTPEQMTGRIAALASTARQEDRQTIAMARTGLEDVTRQLHGYIVSARRGDEQNRWLRRTSAISPHRAPAAQRLRALGGSGKSALQDDAVIS